MTLSELFSPIPEAEFFADYYTQRAIHIPGTSGRFADVFSYQELNHLLNSGPIPLPTLKMAKGGKPLPVEDSIGILEAVQNGATLIIDRIDMYSSRLRSEIAQWSDAMGEPLQVNLYLSQPDNQGFLTHYDTHDVFILQIAGFKRWRIFELTVRFPLWVQKDHDRNVPATPYLDVNLAPGDFLYVPRGHWHDATAYSESSMHLTVGVNARSAVDYLNWLSNELRSRELWRRDFQPASSRIVPEATSASPLQLRAAQLKQDLLAVFDDQETLSAYEAHCKASAKKSFAFDLPDQLRPVSTVEKREFYRTPGQQVWIDDNAGGDIIQVAVEDRLYTLAADASPFVRLIFSRSQFSRDELVQLHPGMSAKLVDDLLSRFVLDGVIHMKSMSEVKMPEDEKCFVTVEAA